MCFCGCLLLNVDNNEPFNIYFNQVYVYFMQFNCFEGNFSILECEMLFMTGFFFIYKNKQPNTTKYIVVFQLVDYWLLLSIRLSSYIFEKQLDTKQLYAMRAFLTFHIVAFETFPNITPFRVREITNATHFKWTFFFY